jgi:uncharacterized membrane protein
MRQKAYLESKAKELRHLLYWAVVTAVAAWLMWTIGDPWMVKHFGTGAPWWAYALLSLRLVGGILHMAAADAALRKEANLEAAAPAESEPPDSHLAPTR